MIVTVSLALRRGRSPAMAGSAVSRAYSQRSPYSPPGSVNSTGSAPALMSSRNESSRTRRPRHHESNSNRNNCINHYPNKK